MSSSQQSSHNSNTASVSNNTNFGDYEIDESLIYQQQVSNSTDNNGDQSDENEMFPTQDDSDDDLLTEPTANLNRARNYNPVDESALSDEMKQAFRKYQNEQDELYAEMEECWNYMIQENHSNATQPNSSAQGQPSTLNPDAAEFQPWGFKPSSTNTGSSTILTTSQTEEQKQH